MRHQTHILEQLPPVATGSRSDERTQNPEPRLSSLLPRSEPTTTSSPTKEKDSYESSELSDLDDDESEAETDKMDFLDDDASATQSGDKVSDLRRISHLTELAHLQGVDSDDSDESDSLHNATAHQPDAGASLDEADTTMFQSFRTDNSDAEEHDSLKRPHALEEADLVAKSSKKAKVEPSLLEIPTLPLHYSSLLDNIEPLGALDTRNGVAAEALSRKAHEDDDSSESDVLEEHNDDDNAVGEELSLQRANGNADTFMNGKKAGQHLNGKFNATPNGLSNGPKLDRGSAKTEQNDADDGGFETVSKPEDFAEPKLEEVEMAEAEAQPEDDSIQKKNGDMNQVKDELAREQTVLSPENVHISHDLNQELSFNSKMTNDQEKTEAHEDDENDLSGADEHEVNEENDDNEAEEEEEEEEEDGNAESGDDGAADDAEPEEDEEREEDEEVDLDLDEHRKMAILELISIEKDFSFLRDKLFSDKLALLEHEMELCLDGSHPELLQIYYKVNEFYQQNIEISNLTLNYSLKCINTETMASRTGIHQDFMKNLTDMKNDMVAETTLLWYKINRERNYLDQLVPDYNFSAIPLLSAESVNMALVAGGSSMEYYDGAPLSKKVMTQNTIVELVQRRNELNEQLGVLNGLKEFHGIPCAVTNSLLDDDVCSVKELLLRKATPEEINEDLQAMGIF